MGENLRPTQPLFSADNRNLNFLISDLQTSDSERWKSEDHGRIAIGRLLLQFFFRSPDAHAIIDAVLALQHGPASWTLGPNRLRLAFALHGSTRRLQLHLE
ncbi:hypothetical protein HRR90_003058 [Exophiala dermatitidis]|uniref:Uncharacterized protein n=1 Tax=Exophiala dermatitidis TaxID=5970 RepID=A0AAN6ET07_EXODE|nr:hypothetical protein HRR73_009252 [Exophiala dermatitidis]KAJ4503401.1 hypothetical protein HRR74_009308 [Exophiala dermatitidis]KAJ4535422.1 hypothetical protein HRR77_008037 [Exophiala dermatitidis]KAJ4564467.1 hypothetical protein HRR79_005730 [Exophiala dermatitidis]KAJ4568748.1 hypothetical protein HRR82_007979 [Exophiala dermatitidis]